MHTDAGVVEPAAASTVVLVRGTGARREVLLLRRPLTAAFAPDAWVFPGGRLDRSDFELDHHRYAAGPTPNDWGRWLEVDEVEAAAYPVAAIREAWEETGILLAEGAAAAGLEEERGALLRGSRSLAGVLRERKLRLSTHRLHYLARWITPADFPRRYDTRFFLAELEPDARCRLVGGELIEARWMTPGEALQAAGRQAMYMMPPTLDTLRRLEGGEV